MHPLKELLENDNLKLCSVCGEEKPLTFEHMPPKASGNKTPKRLIGLENITPYGGYLNGKSKKLRRGFGGYKLCEKCNNLTGSWYAESYIDFSNKLNDIFNNNIGKDNVEFTHKIKPLNFLKQVITILLCSDQATGTLREYISQNNFILNKKENNLHESVFLAYGFTLQQTCAYKGFTVGYTNLDGYSSNMEFLYSPFYFIAAFEKREIPKDLFDLTSFKNYKYDEEIEVKYKLDLGKFSKKNS